MDCRLELICCTILLQIIITCVTAQSLIVNYQQVDVCPANHSELTLNVTDSDFQCAAVCNSNPHCDMFHFNHTTNMCYQGNSSCRGLALWTDGPCKSYRDESNTTENWRNATQWMVKCLTLKLLYRFGNHGLVNIADPSKYKLRNHNVTVNDDGAHFRGDQQSYLVIDNQEFNNNVNDGNTFSMFVVAKHATDKNNFYLDTNAITQGIYGVNVYGSSDGDLKAETAWSLSGYSLKVTSPKLRLTTGLPQQLSSGVTFNGTFFGSFYANQSLIIDNAYDIRYNSPRLSAGSRYLYFGQSTYGDASKALQGSMQCFALSTRVLTQAEFVQLENWCL